jgi:serine/threonine-protein kinase HipA
MRLAIELHDTLIGTIEGDARTCDFIPTADGIERFGANSTVLSVAIPLAPNQRRNHARRRRSWFGELLPEGDQYDYMLAQGGISREDTPAFLARYGRDVAGALQIWDLEDPSEPATPSLQELTDGQVKTLLNDPIGAPLANAPRAGKSSLGGVQPKVVLVKSGAGWAQALGGYPSTHILKPQLGGNKATVIYDEEYGSRLARRLGLATFDTYIHDFDGLPSLVIERFDRTDGKRVHQEDFSQVLGAVRNEKYQEIGGVVSLKRVSESLIKNAPGGDLVRFARMVVFAVGIGNLDMHTKNLGLLHPLEGEVTLAPAYDIVPQAHMPNDGKLALAVNKRYLHGAITRDDLHAELTSWGLRGAARIINDTLEELHTIVSEEEELDGAALALQHQIEAFVDNLLRGSPVGGRAD